MKLSIRQSTRAQLIIGCCLLLLGSIIMLTTLQYYQTKQLLQQQAMKDLSSTVELHQRILKKYLHYTRQNIASLASRQKMVDLIQNLKAIWTQQPEQYDHDLIHQPIDSISPELTKHLIRHHYSDLYLTDLKGNILFSHRPKSMLGQNLLSSPKRNSMLAQAAFMVLDNPAGSHISQLQYHAPSDNELSFFVSHLIQDAEQKYGILIVQIPYAAVLDLFSHLPLTEKAMQFSLITPSLITNTEIANHLSLADSKRLTRNLSSQADISGHTQFTSLMLAQPAVSAITPLNEADLQWQLLLTRSLNHIHQPANKLLEQFLIILLPMTACALIFMIYLISLKLKNLNAILTISNQLYQTSSESSDSYQYLTDLNIIAQKLELFSEQQEHFIRAAREIAQGYTARPIFNANNTRIMLMLEEIRQQLHLKFQKLTNLAEQNRFDYQPSSNEDLIDQAICSLLRRIQPEQEYLQQIEIEAVISAKRSHYLELPKMANTILDEICQRLQLPMGSLYILDENQKFIPFSAYGVSVTQLPQSPDLFYQQSRYADILEFNDIQHQYFHFNTALGHASRCSMLIISIKHGNHTFAVMELCHIAPFTQQHKRLLQKLQPRLGTALHIARTFHLLRRKLRTVQQQKRQIKQNVEEAKQYNQHKNTFIQHHSACISRLLDTIQSLHSTDTTSPEAKQNETYRQTGTCIQLHLQELEDLSNLDRQPLTLTERTISLNQLQQQIHTICDNAAEQHKLSLQIYLKQSTECTLSTDALRIQQIIYQLVNNLASHSQSRTVYLFLEQHDNKLQIDLSNIERSVIEHQTESHRDDQFIAQPQFMITRQLLQLMNASVHVKHFEKYSLITFQCPIQTDIAPSPEVPAHTADDLHILVVDDTPINLQIVQEILADAHIDCQCCHNGREALQIIQETGQQYWHLIITDLQMPEIDGYQLIETLQQIAPDLPVIALTAHTSPESQEKCYRAGVKDFLSKPVFADSLLASVHQYARVKPKSVSQPPSPGIIKQPEPELPLVTQASQVTPDIDRHALSAQFQHRTDFIDRLLETLLQTHHNLPDQLQQAATQKEQQTVSQLTHTMAGICGHLHADSLRAYAKYIEQQMQQPNADSWQSAIELADLFEQLLTKIGSVNKPGKN